MCFKKSSDTYLTHILEDEQQLNKQVECEIKK
nr:MAG TPA: hypothetical protein [Caudoviricetes sp.]